MLTSLTRYLIFKITPYLVFCGVCYLMTSCTNDISVSVHVSFEVLDIYHGLT